MKPYYQHAGITIYHGDCRDVLPTLDMVDLVLTDPPYGLAQRWQGGTWGSADKYKDAKRWDNLIDDETMSRVISNGHSAVVWGGNHYRLPPTRGLLAWVKTNAVLRV